MKKSIFNLLFMILWIVIWVLNPWPFEKSLNSSKTYYIEKTQMVREGFDPLQRNPRDLKKANLPDLKNDSRGQTAKPEQQAAKQSSSSNSNTDSKLKYRPMAGSNPGGSGNYDFNENLSNSGNSDQVISDPGFWDSYLDSKDFCPNVDVELDEDDDWSFKDIVEIPDKVLFQQRRRLLATQPTAELDKSVKSKHNYSNSAITPFSYYSKEGKILTIKNRELEKIVYAHSDDLNLLNFADRVVYPTQTDPTKFQRSECRAVTNSGKKEALVRMLELTTSANPDFITRRLPMPSYPSQYALAYIDTNTNACLFFHADNGKLWSAKKLSQLEMFVILNNPNFENLN